MSSDVEQNKLLPFYKEILNSIPDSIDFNFIPVKSISTKQITLTNNSEISIYFKITNAEGYIFKPNEGILPKNKSLNIIISIEPNSASVIVANAQICLDKKISKIFKLSCVSKYPYLTTNKKHFDLGIIEYGKNSYGEIILINNEPVSAKFSIIRTSEQPGKHPKIFKLSYNKGEVPPMNSFLIKINFIPFFPKSTSYETYELRIHGGNIVKFSLAGACLPLKIYLNAKYINFNTVELGNSITKLIRIYNDSDLETDYQIFHTNGSSVFFIKDNEIQNTIRPHTNLRINVTFKPNQTTLFYERIFVIVKNHCVFSLDLYGSCHDLLHKTMQLSQNFIEIFRYKLLLGEFFNKNQKILTNNEMKIILPEDLKFNENSLEKTGKSKNNSGNLQIDAGNTRNLSSLFSSDSKNQSLQFQLQKEILWETTSNTRIISFSTEHIDFHYVGFSNTSQPYILNVNNNTNYKINIKWILERPIIISNLIKTVNLFENDSSIFIIQPDEAIVMPHKIFSFKVFFKPNKQEYYFYDDIPCLATVIDDKKFNNFQISNVGNLFNKTKTGFTKTLNQEDEKKIFDYQNIQNYAQNPKTMGKTTMNFHHNNSQQKLNKLKPFSPNGKKSPFQKPFSSKKKIPIIPNTQVNFNKKKNYFQELQNKNQTTLNFYNQKNLKKINLLTKNLSKNSKIKSSLEIPYFNPPFTSFLSVVGHSFPPGNQLYIPMFEFEPKNEIFFPNTSINQSQFQIFKIKNKSDTPLFYSFNEDINNDVFKIARKFGLIPAKQFHLILIEFCPHMTTTYRYPLKIMLNHDSTNIKTIILNGFCVDPVIEIENVKNEIYFPPSFIGITTNKKLTIINRSPIKSHVSTEIEKNENCIIEIFPNSFDMEANFIMDINISFTPMKSIDFKSKIIFKVVRIYDEQKDFLGIYNPGNLNNNNEKIEKIKNNREYIKEIMIIGKGSDGELKIEPNILEFGTVKVGFHKKLSFSIFNPTMTNFYIMLEFEKQNNENNLDNNNINNNDNNQEVVSNINDIISLDFKEGLINSFCKKEVQILFKPINRFLVKTKILIYAIEHEDIKKIKKNSITTNNNIQSEISNKNSTLNNINIKTKSLKCSLILTANGDYPLIKIVDIRNNLVGINNLWYLFNVNQANEELQKQLSNEEINYIGDEKTDEKLNDYKSKLKCITLNFGKHIKKKNYNNDSYDIYITLRNDGGVPSEFFFKFPGEVSVMREIWMDPVEPTNNDKFEYHVLKEKIFELEPKKGKLNPGEFCNIKLKYNYKERGTHKLHVIFQVVNGKPLIFQLCGFCFNERQGMLEIKKNIVNFSYVPIGYMDYIVCPLELYNVGGVKIRYKIDKNLISDFNKKNANFEIFKIENLEGNIGPGDLKYIPIFFKPLTSKEYILNLDVFYADESYFAGKIDEQEILKENKNIIKKENEKFGKIPIIIKGIGYHPMKFIPPKIPSPFEKMPKIRICNEFNGEIIQKCGLSIEEIDFGECENNTAKNKTVIIYNFSKLNSLNFEFIIPGFNLKDEIEIRPNKDKLLPNSHKIIKIILTPKGYLSNYEGELDINITWNINDNGINEKKLNKEILHIRIRKKSVLKELPGKMEKSINKNQCFIENILSDLTKEILCEENYQKKLCQDMDEQPLSIFDWINDIEYPDKSKVREILNNKYNKDAKNILLSENTINQEQKINKKYSFYHTHHSESRASFIAPSPLIDNYGENEDYKIQEKYTAELLHKYKLSVGEVNEGLAMVNEDSRKLISEDIMESTVYNIISEAIYGESDLSEKTRIYFFNK